MYVLLGRLYPPPPLPPSLPPFPIDKHHLPPRPPLHPLISLHNSLLIRHIYLLTASWRQQLSRFETRFHRAEDQGCSLERDADRVDAHEGLVVAVEVEGVEGEGWGGARGPGDEDAGRKEGLD